MAKKQALAKTPVVDLPPDPLLAEIAAVANEAPVVKKFLEQVAVFFGQAKALERQADACLLEAKLLKAPTDGAADVKLQQFIKGASDGEKGVGAHWTVTATFFNLHKRLVAHRTRGTSPYVEAKQIAQRLHNTYVETERRRAEEETRRLQREATEREQRRRDEELAVLEAEAVRQEQASPELSERELIFMGALISLMGLDKAHLADGSLRMAQEAARRAGYKDPAASAVRLLDQGKKVIAAILAQQEAARVRRQADAAKAAPLNVQVEEVKADVQKAPGAHDRTTYGVEVFDARLFVEAVIGGRAGIPADCLQPDLVKMGEYARSLRELINRWPGCRMVKKSTTV